MLHNGENIIIDDNTKNSSTLLLKNSQRSHSGNIKCVAKNSTEEDEHEIRLAVVAPPARCNGPIEVSKVTPSGCQLIWKKPDDNFQNILSFGRQSAQNAFPQQ